MSADDGQAKVLWIRTGETLEDGDPRLAWTRDGEEPGEIEESAVPALAEEEQSARTEFATIVRSLCDQYEAGNLDVMLVGFVDQSGRPVPMIAPYPFYANTDALALSDLLHSTTRAVVDHRLRNN